LARGWLIQLFSPVKLCLLLKNLASRFVPMKLIGCDAL